MAPSKTSGVSRVSYRDNVNGMRPQCVGISISEHACLNRYTFSPITRSKMPVTRLSQQLSRDCIDRPESRGNEFQSSTSAVTYRRQMRTTSFALCNAATAFGVGQIDILLG